MSDAYYQQRAARRTRIGCAVGGVLVLVLLALFGLRTMFRDACTDSFDRSPEAVVQSYVDAVRRGDVSAAQQCWEHFSYFDLAAGCSEICLGRLFGAQFRLGDVALEAAPEAQSGRARQTAGVSIVCQDGQEYDGEILLDSTAQALPWRHWRIVHSTVGGTVAEPWCSENQP